MLELPGHEVYAAPSSYARLCCNLLAVELSVLAWQAPLLPLHLQLHVLLQFSLLLRWLQCAYEVPLHQVPKYLLLAA